MAAAVGQRGVCKWRSETVPNFETQIAYNEEHTGIVASLINTETGAVLDSKLISVAAVFERCVWRANDLPDESPLESRLFRSSTNKKASWVGIDLDTQTIYISPYTQFDDNRLKTHAPVFNRETSEVEFQEIPQPRHEAYDPHAEKGVVRTTRTGEEETVHVWDHVGENGMNDLRLIHQKMYPPEGAPQETLILRLFYRSTGAVGQILLTNRSPTLLNPEIPIPDRVTNFAQHPTVFLEGRSGNAYRSVTLSGVADVPHRYQGFYQGRNLQSASTEDIAVYIRENLFVLREQNGQVQGAVRHRLRVAVSRLPNYDFGPEHGKLDTIHIHMAESALRRWGYLPFQIIFSVLSGMLNSDAPKTRQLRDLDTAGMEDLFLEDESLMTPEANGRKLAIFKEFDRTIEAGADVDYYIAENRKTARLKVGGLAYEIRSGATAVGRFLTFRCFWDTPEQRASVDNSLSAFQTGLTALGVVYPAAAPVVGAINAGLGIARLAGGVSSSANPQAPLEGKAAGVSSSANPQTPLEGKNE